MCSILSDRPILGVLGLYNKPLLHGGAILGRENFSWPKEKAERTR